MTDNEMRNRQLEEAYQREVRELYEEHEMAMEEAYRDNFLSDQRVLKMCQTAPVLPYEDPPY